MRLGLQDFRQALIKLGHSGGGGLGAGLFLGQSPVQGLPDAVRGSVDFDDLGLAKITGHLLQPLIKIVAQAPAMLIHQFGNIFQQLLEQQPFGQSPGEEGGYGHLQNFQSHRLFSKS